MRGISRFCIVYHNTPENATPCCPVSDTIRRMGVPPVIARPQRGRGNPLSPVPNRTRHCEERSDVAIRSPPVPNHTRHCEERSDVAIRSSPSPAPTVPRIPTSPVCALVPRNDSYFCPTAPVIARSAATRQSVFSGACFAPSGARHFCHQRQKCPKTPPGTQVPGPTWRAVAQVLVAAVSRAITDRGRSSQQSRMPSAFWTRYRFAAAPGRSCTRPAPLAGGQSRPPLRGKWESILRRAGPMCPAAVAFIFRPGRTQRSRASTGPRGTSGCRGKYP